MKALMALAVVSMVLLAVIPANAALDDRDVAEQFILYLPQAQDVIPAASMNESLSDR